MTDYNKLKKYGKKLGENAIQDRIIAIAQEVTERECYKDAIKALGVFKALAISCGENTTKISMKDAGERFSRESTAIDTIIICKHIIANNKDAINYLSKLYEISELCKVDDYWSEKLANGYYYELWRAEKVIRNSPFVDSKICNGGGY